MPKNGSNVYEVKLTALRRRQDETGGAPDLSKRWTFVQLQQDARDPQDALHKMLEKFFRLHPHDAVLLPKGPKGFKELVSPAGADDFLSRGDIEHGSVQMGNDEAALNVVLLPAMSGKMPKGLPTPKSDREYSERLEKNFEVGPAYETMLVQMPSPVKGNTMPSSLKEIQYKGHLYRPVRFVEDPTNGLKQALMDQMDVVVATTDLYLQNKASAAALDGTLRLASLISDRLTEVARVGIVSGSKRIAESRSVNDTDVLMKIQRIKDHLNMRSKDADLAVALRAVGTALTANDAVRAMKDLIEVSPALNGTEGPPSSLAVVNTNFEGEDIPWVVYIDRPEWDGPTYVYDALTHTAYYDELDDKLYAKMEQKLDELARSRSTEEEDVPEETEAPREPARMWA